MPDDELARRVSARFVETERIGDVGPLLTEDAATDAAALLIDAAPAPDKLVSFGPVVLACWTHWYRATAGARNPEAEQDAMLALALRNVLRPHLTDLRVLPSLAPGVAEFEPDVFLRLSGFACIMAGACGKLAMRAMRRESKSDANALFDQAIAWLLDADAVMPTEHEGFGDVSTVLTALYMQRYEALADPESLAAAGRSAARTCALVPSTHPRQGTHLPLMLDVAARSALLLGRPTPAEVDDLVRSSGITPLPDTARRIARMRDLRPVPGALPGEVDAALGAMLFTDAVEHDDLPVLACAAVRLRAALPTLPADHRTRGVLIGLVRTAFARLGWDDPDLPAPPADLSARIDAAVYGFDSQWVGHPAAGPGPPLDSILGMAEELATRRGLSGLPGEIRAAIAFVDCLVGPSADDPPDRSGERMDRYRRAFGSLGGDRPERHAYGTILAAVAWEQADAVADSAPDVAVQLRALAAEVIADIGDAAPDGYEPLRWLRAGHAPEAKMAALCLFGGPAWSAEAVRAFEVMGSDALRAMAESLHNVAAVIKREHGVDLAGLRAMLNLGSGEGHGTGVTTALLRDLRTAIDQFGAEDAIQDAVGDLLTATLGASDLPNLELPILRETVELLRRLHERSDRPSPAVSARLHELLTMLATVTNDPALVLEAAAIQDAVEDSERVDSVPDAARAFRSTYFTVLTGTLAYVLTHDQDQLAGARRAVARLVELGVRLDAERGATGAGNRIQAESLRDLLDTLGPSGGPATHITDEMVERCRETYRAAPPGERASFAGMTVVQVLTQRSMALRETDAAGAARLLDEAEATLDAVAAHTPDSLVATVRGLIGMQRGGPGAPIDPSCLPPVPDATGEPAETIAGMIDFMSRRITHAMGGHDLLAFNIATLRSPHLSVLMRAHAGIAAAVRAADPNHSDIDLALSLGEETIGLLERLTDRGGPERAAEHGLLGFDGDTRGLATQIVFNLLLTRNRPLPDPAPDGGAGDRAADDPTTEPIRVVRGSRVDAVVALHERGRGLLLARWLESRADLGSLTAAHPSRAIRFKHLTARLEAGVGGTSHRDRLVGWRTSKELDELIEQIRERPGFADFLGSLSPARLRELAAGGPIIVLNHARNMSCVAFIVTSDEITALHLDIMARDVTDAAQRLRRAIESIYARGGRRPPPAELIAARDTIHRTLSWTWHAVVEPVFDRLGRREATRPGADWPRIWWVPTGPFNAIPLHAAQCARADCAEGRCGSALDTVVSSYIPGFQTLAYARARAARRQGPGVARALVVSESDDALPGAGAAARLATEALAGATLLVGDRATRAAVRAALEDSPWVQFGCHAHSSPEEPAGSQIELPSGEFLSVSDICRIRPDSARLAVLTACGTARTSERLADEAVHVSSAFLLAGYPEAVGTLWEVESTQIGAFLRGFYRRALADGASAAHGVHHAARELRARAPDRPHIWAAYVHAGA